MAFFRKQGEAPKVQGQEQKAEELSAKAAVETARRQQAVEEVAQKFRDEAAAKAATPPKEKKEKRDENVPQVGDEGKDYIVVDKKEFFEMAVRLIRTNAQMSQFYLRKIGALVGIQDYTKARQFWQRINAWKSEQR